MRASAPHCDQARSWFCRGARRLWEDSSGCRICARTRRDALDRLLILTHTHAACSVFAERTRGGAGVEIRTIDSLITHIATASP